MNHPNPAIVAQASVRRLPRPALLLLCLAFIAAGFVGRDAWRSADLSALGFMAALSRGEASWWNPTLLGASPDFPALLPYWLGAWALQLAPSGWAADFWVRIPFILLLTLAFVSTWYGSYYLARTPSAQPVAFAFGGEARPTDYARAMADGGLLAFLASLGLAQLAHETTPALAQLGFGALLFYALSALPYHRTGPLVCAAVGMSGMSLSGAPALSLLWGLGGALIHSIDSKAMDDEGNPPQHRALDAALLVAMSVAIAWICRNLGLWVWKIEWPTLTWDYWNGHIQLLLWFTWPAWPLALYSAWRWRKQLFNLNISRHLSLPAWLIVTSVGTMLLSGAPDRTLLLALPAFAAMAAFALPTLRRQVAALIDWFTLLFFTGCGVVIWVVWIAMQTGTPPQPAANVARLAPGFEAEFQLIPFAFAVMATLAWAWLVRWRAGRHRAAIWKSLVLPASGASLCWLLLMTLWMPLLDYAQSAKTMVKQTRSTVSPQDCAIVLNLDLAQTAALSWYGGLDLQPLNTRKNCPWMLTEPARNSEIPAGVDRATWGAHTLVQHPVAGSEMFWILKRHGP
ncbi:hypothetical protein [Rhodoferax sp.]|uniref:hypothetical protein n=1 Tax=Rhodoferax sp. TaxID=50421 RepID=UPI0025D0B2F5|nr:hypothetical protein [Rhodoferax sp.]